MALSRHYSQRNLDEYFDGIGKLLGRSERRAHFAMYALGLLSKIPRKSLEPIAELAAKGSPDVCEKLHQVLTIPKIRGKTIPSRSDREVPRRAPIAIARKKSITAVRDDRLGKRSPRSAMIMGYFAVVTSTHQVVAVLRREARSRFFTWTRSSASFSR